MTHDENERAIFLQINAIIVINCAHHSFIHDHFDIIHAINLHIYNQKNNYYSCKIIDTDQNHLTAHHICRDSVNTILQQWEEREMHEDRHGEI